MVYMTTKDLLDNFVTVASVRAYGRGAVISGTFGRFGGVTFKHQFGSGSEAERKILALSPDELPVLVRIVKKGRCLDLEFEKEVRHA